MIVRGGSYRREAATFLAVSLDERPGRHSHKQANSTADARGWAWRPSRSFTAECGRRPDEPHSISGQGSIRVHPRASAVEFACFLADPTLPQSKPRLPNGKLPYARSAPGAARTATATQVRQEQPLASPALRQCGRCRGQRRRYPALRHRHPHDAAAIEAPDRAARSCAATVRHSRTAARVGVRGAWSEPPVLPSEFRPPT
jgi:hypothetical protein